MALAYTTAFEYARIRGLRLASLEVNGKTLVKDVDNTTTPDTIVSREFQDPKLLPLTILRPGPLPDQYVLVRPEELRMEHSFSEALFPDAMLRRRRNAK
jgi:hypothetical protein